MSTRTYSPSARLGTFSLVMITLVSVDSLRNLPATALFGTPLLFFFVMAAIFFLIPNALVSAELSSGWPKQGGVYVWVKEAFGQEIGFLAIWLQWVENVIWYPTILSFVTASIAYLLHPDLVHNRWFLITTILVIFWGATLVNILGMKVSAGFSTFCTLIGLLIPMAVIITLSSIWVITHHPLQIELSWSALLPKFNDTNTWVSLTAIILSLCGIEIATVHARNVENPQKTFPKALIYATVIILLTLVLGSLAIAIVLPAANISLVAGIMQAFHAFFAVYHIPWMLPMTAIMLIIGGVGGMINWIIAPVKGLCIALKDRGSNPRLFQENRHGAPTRILIYQAILVTLLTLLFLFVPTINAAYWILTDLSAQLYMGMYILMLATGVCLRYSQPDQERCFRIPGGRSWGMWCVALLGIIGSGATLFIGFIPPEQIHAGNTLHYALLMLLGLLLIGGFPFLFKPFYRCFLRHH